MNPSQQYRTDSPQFFLFQVADCICLMALGHLQAIPVDTHIYQIAARFYMPKLVQQKTVTEKVYNEIGDHFRELYGPLAGWAHTVGSDCYPPGKCE